MGAKMYLIPIRYWEDSAPIVELDVINVDDDWVCTTTADDPSTPVYFDRKRCFWSLATAKRVRGLMVQIKELRERDTTDQIIANILAKKRANPSEVIRYDVVARPNFPSFEPLELAQTAPLRRRTTR